MRPKKIFHLTLYPTKKATAKRPCRAHKGWEICAWHTLLFKLDQLVYISSAQESIIQPLPLIPSVAAKPLSTDHGFSFAFLYSTEIRCHLFYCSNKMAVAGLHFTALENDPQQKALQLRGWNMTSNSMLHLNVAAPHDFWNVPLGGDQKLTWLSWDDKVPW